MNDRTTEYQLRPAAPHDVPAIVAAGYSPVVPVVVMDEREPGNVLPAEAVTAGAQIESGAELFTASK